MLHELFKQKGTTTDPMNYRDVSICAQSSKVFGKHLRKCIQGSCDEVLLESQWGSGRNGGDTNITHLYVHMLFNLGEKQGLSTSITFLDIRNAFASMVRSLLFDNEEGDEQWLLKLAELGYALITGGASSLFSEGPQRHRCDVAPRLHGRMHAGRSS